MQTISDADSHLEQLIQRLEAATGPDRELDRAIAEDALGLITEWLEAENSPARVLSIIQTRGQWVGVELPYYTGSTDDALTLVDPEWFFHFSRFSKEAGEPRCEMHLYGPTDNWRGEGATMPAAICIAYLKARMANAR